MGDDPRVTGKSDPQWVIFPARPVAIVLLGRIGGVADEGYGRRAE